MSVILLHLSDAHLKSPRDPLILRAEALAQVVASEANNSVSEIAIAFTGDATDKGSPSGFDIARSFLATLISRLETLTKLKPFLFIIPGNHDLVLPDDTSVRDVLIGTLAPDAAKSRPTAAIEKAILQPLDYYFDFASNLNPDGTLSRTSPYYAWVDKSFGAYAIRFHLLNTSWMCASGQGMGTLLFPVEEIQPPTGTNPPDYEIALLHHPFDWFKQPESMRPLREAVEAISDLILTGHEHVGRATRVSVVGKAEHEYREGEALQDGINAQSSGFHLLNLDFERDRQSVITYQWQRFSSGEGYVRIVGPSVATLGRNKRRAAHAYRLRLQFEDKLNDPELPVTHWKRGRPRLADFYTYPDIKRLGARVDKNSQFVRGDDAVDTIADTPKTVLFGPDRCGKTSLAKMLFLDLHRRGDVPLLVNGVALKNMSTDRLSHTLESLVEGQYESIQAELFWQIPLEKRVLILDDLQLGPLDAARRDELISELGRRFDRAILLTSLEYFFEELFPANDASATVKSSLMAYEHFRILPFGYGRCDRFVRNWIKLDTAEKPDEFEEKVSEITGILTHFLRSNPIPQYPWVVMIIVQQADSTEPLHAENGSYGYLLQALITAALSRSRLKHPINGKYAWLSELASELYTQNRNSLSDSEARQVHERYLRDYGVADLDYKEIRDDLDLAGVLRVEGGEVLFRQSYTYCYFVAWHLTQRIHAGDTAARAEVRELCNDLGHEDAANVLVFLAHLTTSHVVVEEMMAKAKALFSESFETDFVRDVGPINNIYTAVQ